MATDTDKMAFFARLHELDELCDFTLVSRGAQCTVHRLVLSAHSKVLEKACAGGFAEASQRTLDLSEYHSNILDAFVEYMYYFDYDSSIEKHYPTEEGLLEFHVQMCVIADKYDMQPLKVLAVKKFKAALDNTNSTDDLADAARCAYDASPATEEIREQIVKKAAKDPLVGVNAAPKTTLEDVMMKYPEFAVTVANAACGFVYPTTSSSKREARWNLFECQAAARCGYTGRQSVFVDYPVPNCPRCGRLFAPVDKAESS